MSALLELGYDVAALHRCETGELGGEQRPALGSVGMLRADMWPPAFAWPADHAWCVAFDVDSHWAGIGASADVIECLIDNQDLDIVRTEPGEHVPYYW